MTPRQVVVTVEIAAPLERVWRALTEPEEVGDWDGAVPLAVPADYPAGGQHARWRVHVLRIPVTLHDRVREVEPPVVLAADLGYGIVRIAERYELAATGGGCTRLTSTNEVRSVVPGLGRVVSSRVGHHVRGALNRLRAHCETGQEP